MADRDDDSSSNRGFASMDKETRERIARKGGEEPYQNDPGRSESGRGGSPGERTGPSSSREGGSSRGGQSGGGGGSRGGGEGRGGVWYDEDAGQCRDESGQFIECPPGMGGKGTREDPNKERVASKGDEARGGRGESERGGASSISRGESSKSRGGPSGGERGGSSSGRD